MVVAVRGLGNTLRARWLASQRGRRPGARVAARAPAPAGKVAAAAPAPRAAGPVRGRVSAIPLRPLPAFRVPEIAVGMGEKPAKIAPLPAPTPARPVAPKIAAPAASGALPRMVSLTTPLAAPAPKPVLACAPDEGRIRNYAARIASSVGLQPSDDLALFVAEARPLPRLAPVMLAMSGFELGLLRASADLVAGAVERVAQRQRDEAARAAVPAP